MKRSDARRIKVSGEEQTTVQSRVSEDSIGADGMLGEEVESDDSASVDSQNSESQGTESKTESKKQEAEDQHQSPGRDENYDKYLRALADLENVKKRHAKERSDLIRYAGEHLARDLVEVVDNLELALKQKGPAVNDELLKGVEMIYKQFVSILEKHAVSSESAIGKAFDPQKHQAMTSVPTTEFEAGMVMEEYRKAYFFKDRLLRPGQVVVAASPEVEPSKQDEVEDGEPQGGITKEEEL